MAVGAARLGVVRIRLGEPADKRAEPRGEAHCTSRGQVMPILEENHPVHLCGATRIIAQLIERISEPRENIVIDSRCKGFHGISTMLKLVVSRDLAGAGRSPSHTPRRTITLLWDWPQDQNFHSHLYHGVDNAAYAGFQSFQFRLRRHSATL